MIFTETEGARKESLLYLANGSEPGPDLVLWHRAALLDPEDHHQSFLICTDMSISFQCHLDELHLL